MDATGEKLLKDLGAAFKAYADEERKNLREERTFLQTVLDKSLGGAVEQANTLAYDSALDAVSKLVPIS
ncbi:MAG: hypothetical protein ACOYOB_20260 [Myxococcota bacterium]